MIGEPTIRRWFDATGALAIVGTAVLGAVLLLLFARGLLDHPPLYDELLHLLSARGVVATGQPIIDSGMYTRAELFTRAVALALQTFGDDAISARIPALASAAVLVALIGAWCCYRAGLLAGIVTAGLLAAAPSTLSLSVLARFYTMHALVVAGTLIAMFEMLAPGRSRATRAVLAAVALLLLPLAYHLQVTTLIAVGAGVLACLTLVAVDHYERIRELVARRPIPFAAGVAGAIAVGLLAAWQLDVMELLGATPLWAANRAGRLAYYNSNLVSDYPLLYPLLPFAALAAVAVNRRLGLFCIVVVAAAFVVHSIAAQKALRYFYHVLPFVCVIWGCAFRYVVGLLGRSLQTVTTVSAGSALIAALLLAAFTVANSQEGQRTVKLVLGRGAPESMFGHADEADWSLAADALRPYLAQADRLIVSSSVKGMFYFGRYDYELNSSVVLETESHAEFGRDPRTGRQAIGAAESVARVVREPGVTVVVIEDEKLDNDVGAAREAVDVIRARCTTIEVPRASRVSAWRCGG